MAEKKLSPEEWEIFSVTQNQLIDLHAHTVATLRVLKQLAEKYPNVATEMAEYEAYHREALEESMMRIEDKFGSEFAAAFDKRKI